MEKQPTLWNVNSCREYGCGIPPMKKAEPPDPGWELKKNEKRGGTIFC